MYLDKAVLTYCFQRPIKVEQNASDLETFHPGIPDRSMLPKFLDFHLGWTSVHLVHRLAQSPGNLHVLTSVSDDVIEHHQPLKLQQEMPVGVLSERFCFKTP